MFGVARWNGLWIINVGRLEYLFIIIMLTQQIGGGGKEEIGKKGVWSRKWGEERDFGLESGLILNLDKVPVDKDSPITWWWWWWWRRWRRRRWWWWRRWRWWWWWWWWWWWRWRRWWWWWWWRWWWWWWWWWYDRHDLRHLRCKSSFIRDITNLTFGRVCLGMFISWEIDDFASRWWLFWWWRRRQRWWHSIPGALNNGRWNAWILSCTVIKRSTVEIKWWRGHVMIKNLLQDTGLIYELPPRI